MTVRQNSNSLAGMDRKRERQRDLVDYEAFDRLLTGETSARGVHPDPRELRDYTERYNRSRLEWLLGVIQLSPKDFRRKAKPAHWLSEKIALFCGRYAPEAFKPLPLSEIERLAREICAHFRAHLLGKPWAIQAGPGLIRRAQFDRRRRAQVISYVGNDLAAEFRWSAHELLTAERASVGQCEGPNCGGPNGPRLFIKTKAQRYCSTACSQRRRSQDFYTEHKIEISEERQRRYEEKKAERERKRAARAPRRATKRISKPATKGR